MNLLSPKRRLLGNKRSRQRPGARRLAGAAALVVSAIALLTLGKLYPDEVADARARLAGPVSSIVGLLQAPLKPLRNLGTHYENLVGLEDELKTLRTENEELRAWKWRALDLERQLADLQSLTRVVSDPAMNFVSTTVRARSFGKQNRSVLVGAGTSSGVVESLAVINVKGLVGTTYEVGHSTTRVRFLTDPASRLVVSIGPQRIAAMASGDGTRTMAIEADTGSLDVAIDDEVVSAGEEGGPPRGLHIGRVVATGYGMRIEPYVDFNRLEFVSVLLPAHIPKSGPTAASEIATGTLAARFNDGAPVSDKDDRAASNRKASNEGTLSEASR